MASKTLALSTLISGFSAAILAVAQQTAPPVDQQHRDMRLDTDTKVPAPEKTGEPVKIDIPRSYALVVGISHYANLPDRAQLKFPERDAADIYTTLISSEGGQFPAENVHKLLGPQATVANIRNELENWLPSVSNSNDRVLIYFAGHGFVKDGRAFLAPYDVNVDDLPNTSYPMEKLGQVFGSKIKAKWRVLLTDACHSGSIMPVEDAQAFNKSAQGVSPSIFSLTASRDREQSFESPRWGGGHGVFTYFVVKGMDGEADTSGDGAVTADELADYVYTNARRETETRQNPTFDRGSWDKNMILAYDPSHARVHPAEAPKVGRLMIEANMDGVEVFVDGKSEGVISKGKPLPLPGLTPGVHTVKGVRMGYEPYGPEDETVYPGQDTTVTVRITIARRKNRAAVDLYDKGVVAYTNGNQQNYKKAVELFTQALQLDPTYSQAALYLASSYNALFDEEKSEEYFKKAIELDPDYVDARVRYGGVLLDKGKFDDAIRQLNQVERLDPNNATAHYMMSVAFTRKGGFAEAVREGHLSIQLAPQHGEAHFWLAESLRMTGQYADAQSEYLTYLKLSDFDSKLAGKMNYYVLGYLVGMGRKKRAAQHDIWTDLRDLTYFGLCDCARLTKKFDDAIQYCQSALAFDAQDPFAHYDLALAFTNKYNTDQNLGLLVAARKHFRAVIEANAETDEAAKSKNYIQKIDNVLPPQTAQK